MNFHDTKSNMIYDIQINIVGENFACNNNRVQWFKIQMTRVYEYQQLRIPAPPMKCFNALHNCARNERRS